MDQFLIDVSSSMKEESPVFIVGAPRSGTSILYRILQKHSSFKIQKDPTTFNVELTETQIFSHPYNILKRTSNKTRKYFLHDENCYRQFVEAAKDIRKYQDILIGKKYFYRLSVEVNFLRPLAWKMYRNDALTRLFFYYAIRARRVSRILEKTPTHIFFLEELKETFPKAKLIFIQRHPLDVYSSYKKRFYNSLKMGVDKKDLRWLKMSPRRFSKKYAKYSSLALKEQELYPRNILLVKYEDLVSKPDEKLRNICQFLGEPYEDTCIPKSGNENMSWKLDPNLFGGLKAKTKNWEAHVEKVDAQHIENCLEEYMDRFGYFRYT